MRGVLGVMTARTPLRLFTCPPLPAPRLAPHLYHRCRRRLTARTRCTLRCACPALYRAFPALQTETVRARPRRSWTPRRGIDDTADESAVEVASVPRRPRRAADDEVDMAEK
jgi:hypothetical protein